MKFNIYPGSVMVNFVHIFVTVLPQLIMIDFCIVKRE